MRGDEEEDEEKEERGTGQGRARSGKGKGRRTARGVQGSPGRSLEQAQEPEDNEHEPQSPTPSGEQGHPELREEV